MVDFSKRVSSASKKKIIEPVELYGTLDRAHDKGPLRPSQVEVLTQWNKKQRHERDVIVKLHTGQGKTLIGLLMLQAKLNEGKGPALYLCPNNFLIEQTCEQAEQFGIPTCMAEGDLPDDFLDSKKILVTSVQKLFNGLSKFGLGNRGVDIGVLLMDDAHACTDNIREACKIRIPRDDAAYDQLKTLFAAELEKQGAGTFADIELNDPDAFLPVPYWSWLQHEADVATILSKGADRTTIKFAWPLLKDMLKHCLCVVSGNTIEIELYIAPLEKFSSYWKAAHRIFMSATVTNDAFLIKGLQLSADTITNPLTYEKERWSGEKMILIPSLIDDTLTRQEIVNYFGKPVADRNIGVVALVSSNRNTCDWKALGARVTATDTLTQAIENLRKRKCEETVVLVNRYDGIDLADSACRILIFDNRPYSQSLIDLYQESCRADSQLTLLRMVRTVEQGMGRSVRGEKDYSVIVVVGHDLTRLLRDKTSKIHLSSQMNKQVEIGLEIAAMAEQEIAEGEKPLKAFVNLIKQCLARDEGWKAFYTEHMDTLTPTTPNNDILNIYTIELKAEQKYILGDPAGAAKELQHALDSKGMNENDKSWYLQEMARYNYETNRAESERLQVAAHKGNRLLLRPPSGVSVAKLTIVSEGRIGRIIDWVKEHGTYDQLNIKVSSILGNLAFGTKAEVFEQALDDLSTALGFKGERPDKEWKEGPDNIWALDDTNYIVWECKSEVDINRAEIHKTESEQMNRSCAWFQKHYPTNKSTNILIHPARKVSSAAAFTYPVGIITDRDMRKFLIQVRSFFKAFEAMDFKDLSPPKIQELVDAYKLRAGHLPAYSQFPVTI